MRMPPVAERLLRGLIADPELEEAVLGDLAEGRSGRAAEEGAEAAEAWYRDQALRSAPHLLAAWWRDSDAGHVRATLGRAVLVLVAALVLAALTFVGVSIASDGPPGWPPRGGRHAVAVSMIFASAGWALAGGLVVAGRSRRAPMAATLLLAVGWIPATAVPTALFPVPSGAPVWFCLAFPATLIVATAVGGAGATLLGWSDARSASGTDPSIPEDAMKTEKTAYRLAARPVLATTILLAVPLAAMQFTDEVAWDLLDFAVMGTLVCGVGLAFELALTRTEDSAYRWAAGVALGAAFLLVWMSIGVGLIGADGDPANLMYAGVLAVGTAGALVARFRPRGMARAMVAAAVAQGLVAGIAVVGGLGRPYSGAWELVLGNGFFVALFLGSGWLFRKAARRRPTAGAGAGP